MVPFSLFFFFSPSSTVGILVREPYPLFFIQCRQVGFLFLSCSASVLPFFFSLDDRGKYPSTPFLFPLSPSPVLPFSLFQEAIDRAFLSDRFPPRYFPLADDSFFLCCLPMALRASRVVFSLFFSFSFFLLRLE